MNKIAFIYSLFLTLAAAGQGTRLPLSLQRTLDKAPEDQHVHLFLKGEQAGIEALTARLGGTYKGRFRSYARVVIPAGKVRALDTARAVRSIHFEDYRGGPLLSNSRSHTRTDAVHDGTANLYGAYTGDSVIMGVIDAGLDLDHPDFHYPNTSRTRVIELWDQTLPYDAQHTPSYGYGQVWDSAEINAGLCPHEDQANYYGHGTNTTGIAAGNQWLADSGAAPHLFDGHAPGCELIIVSSNFNALNWTATIADAVDYIFSRAEALGRPCVINASLGTYLGSHDGRDLPAQMISDLITEKEGRIMVCAAGNSGSETPYHLGYTATSDTNFTWFTPGGPGIFFEMYGDTGDFEQLHFAIGADKVSPYHAFRGNIGFDHILNRLYQLVEDTLFSTSGNYLARVQTWGDSLNGTYRLQFYISSIDSAAYRYRLMCTGGGRMDIWSAQWLGLSNMIWDNLPSVNVFPDIAFYKQPDEFQSIVSSWACSEKVITVGNFINQTSYIDVDGNTVQLSGLAEGAIAANSSSGPARTGLVKPEVTAPGDITLTAGAAFQISNQLAIPSQRNRVAITGRHNRSGGTSSASPVVAGIAALFLEKCPKATWQDYRDALVAGAKADQFTGSVPNFRWGYGKADAVSALKYTNLNPGISISQAEFCDGDSAEVLLNGNYESVWWSNGVGDTTGISVKQSGLYFAQVTDGRQCFGHSDTAAIFKRPLPEKPTLVVEGASPACPGEAVEVGIEALYGAYDWSNGKHTQYIEVLQAGSYHCTVSNIHGCENYSDTAEVDFHPETPLPVLTLKASGHLHARVEGADSLAWKWYFHDEYLSGFSDSLLEVEDPGTYRAAYIDSNGCERSSVPVDVYHLGVDRPEQGFSAFPNPFNEVLHVRSSGQLFSCRLLDALGRPVWQESAPGKMRLTIPTQGMATGVYMLELTTASGVHLMKVMK